MEHNSSSSASLDGNASEASTAAGLEISDLGPVFVRFAGEEEAVSPTARFFETLFAALRTCFASLSSVKIPSTTLTSALARESALQSVSLQLAAIN